MWVWVRRAYHAAASVPVTSFGGPWSSGPENVAIRDNQNEILVALLRHERGWDSFSRSACSHAPHLWQNHQRRSCEQREGYPCGRSSQARHRAKDHPQPGITSTPLSQQGYFCLTDNLIGCLETPLARNRKMSILFRKGKSNRRTQNSANNSKSNRRTRKSNRRTR